jgi:TonB-dependent receptor
MRGNAGARVIKTNTSSDGFITSTSGGFDPLSVQASYTNVLPSFNLKADLTSRLAVRVAASKVLTRPDFSQLTPTVQLQPIFNTGGGGNSALGPITADQYDLSLEYYISKSSLVYAAGFIKNVEGFITNVVTSETINGSQYLIGRPQNGESGKIRGAEVGWNQFLDFLPAPFDGFGFQANYTYVFSEGPSPLTGIVVPLQGLSKHSYNLVGLYEKGPVSLRVAYNWRSKFIAGIGGGGSGFQPDTNAGGGFLDASASYDVGDNLTLFVDGANLLRTRTFTYFGAPTRPHGIAVTDRRFGFGARVRF